MAPVLLEDGVHAVIPICTSKAMGHPQSHQQMGQSSEKKSVDCPGADDIDF